MYTFWNWLNRTLDWVFGGLRPSGCLLALLGLVGGTFAVVYSLLVRWVR